MTTPATPMLPCPFCGGAAVFGNEGDGPFPYFVTCQFCAALTDSTAQKQEAIDLWNTRQQQAVTAQLVAALEAAERFIVNGVEYGFIRMPDPSTPDSAHETLPAIRAAISAGKGGVR